MRLRMALLAGAAWVGLGVAAQAADLTVWGLQTFNTKADEWLAAYDKRKVRVSARPPPTRIPLLLSRVSAISRSARAARARREMIFLALRR